MCVCVKYIVNKFVYVFISNCHAVDKKRTNKKNPRKIKEQITQTYHSWVKARLSVPVCSLIKSLQGLMENFRVCLFSFCTYGILNKLGSVYIIMRFYCNNAFFCIIMMHYKIFQNIEHRRFEWKKTLIGEEKSDQATSWSQNTQQQDVIQIFRKLLQAKNIDSPLGKCFSFIFNQSKIN